MILPIHVYGDPILRTPTHPVDEITPEIQQLIQDMIETMHGASGLGLAAPQVGRTERLFVIDLSPLKEELTAESEAHGTIPPLPLNEPIALINPKIVWSGDEEVEFEEGCLSIPDIRENVWRPDVIRIQFTTPEGEEKEIEARGMFSRVMQHEYDHLNGILFIDLISPFRQRLIKRKLREIARGQVEADYPLALPTQT